MNFVDSTKSVVYFSQCILKFILIILASIAGSGQILNKKLRASASLRSVMSFILASCSVQISARASASASLRSVDGALFWLHAPLKLKRQIKLVAKDEKLRVWVWGPKKNSSGPKLKENVAKSDFWSTKMTKIMGFGIP